MLFNSFDFLVFFPIVVIIYFLIPQKIKYIWLLITSCYFYMCWNPKYIILIATSVLITYLSGIVLDKTKNDMHRKIVVAVSFLSNLSILCFFKYADFLLGNINAVLAKMNVALIEKPFDVLLPVGISFYTFQALSYTMDVYRKEIDSEKNFFKYALFVTFFPQLVAGPIERSKNLLNDIRTIPEKKMWDYDRITKGLIMMLYGLFLKLVIADRVAIMVDFVFNNYQNYDSLVLLIGAVGFSLQIYCDFASYSTIAIGAANVMGFKLMENFDTPYFARSIKEFWRRWHISLSTWFRDYLYIPLGGNRCSKFRKHLNLLIIFTVSGIWHGAGWHYIAWGFLHGMYQVIGEWFAPLKTYVCEKMCVKTESLSHKLLQTVTTFSLVTFAWIFFRANSMREALGYVKGLFSGYKIDTIFDETLLNIGLNEYEWNVLFVSLLILFLVSLVKYNFSMNLAVFLQKQSIWFRWAVIYILLFMTIIYGKYGPKYSQQAFIYFQF